MNQNLTHRRATINDLKAIVMLLYQDELGKSREQLENNLDRKYIEAFKQIDGDHNQYLMVVEDDGEIVGTCHLTIMPSLTFTGSIRMQIEAVRIDEEKRGQKIGEWMMRTAIEYGKSKGASIMQLTTNKKRLKAKVFYEKLGFEATHEGLKMYL